MSQEGFSLHPVRTTSILLSLSIAGLLSADAHQSATDDSQVSNYWSRHHQRILDSYVQPGFSPSNPSRASQYSQSLGDAESTLRDVQVGNVHERVRDLLSDANDRYWQRRFDTDTIPGDAWTPQQAGWMTPAGEPAVKNWPWWAW